MELLVHEPQGSLYICSQHPAIVSSSEKLKRTRPPLCSHTEKQQRPIVTNVGFWIQYNKIALSLSPSSPLHTIFGWKKLQSVVT